MRLWHILRIFWKARISDEEVCRRRPTDQPPLTHIICTTRLKFFGYIVHMLDHSRAIGMCDPSLCQGTGTADRAYRVHTWLQTDEFDLAPMVCEVQPGLT